MPFTEHNVNGLIFDTADGLSAVGGIRHAFTTRHGGVSKPPFDSLNFFESTGDTIENVRENYRLLGAAAGLDMSRAAACRQIHSDRVRFIRAEDAGKLVGGEKACDADAMLTDVPGLPLVVKSADCCTILLYDPTCRCVGAIHAGWRGTALGIALKALVAMMSAYGADPMTIHAAVGPSIGACCFETDADVPDAIRAELSESADRFIEKRGDKYYVDLKQINRLWLLRGGLDPHNIEVHGDCTACRADRYWSYRRLGAVHGGQIALIALEEPL
ncbi:MAG: peptidoglycan editing factor PgeF [Oscillospiraceae bacterium]|nr:peptidoglycan editing factor PgeF [Oscillospiraceae bacterium]